MRPFIIATTGTKGKTSVTRLLAHIMHASGQRTLRVDTHELALNEKRLPEYTNHRSMALCQVGLTVCPGRFFHLLDTHNIPLAILETSITCGLEGTAYRWHDIGIFLNVYGDHLSLKTGLHKPADIAIRKGFIFEKIRPNGWAVFNADDKLVVEQLARLDPSVHLLPFGRDFTYFDLKKHTAAGGKAITLDGTWAVLVGKQREQLVDTSKLSWTFDGQFTPSVTNALAICAALVAYSGGTVPAQNIMQALRASALDPQGGRLQLLTGSHNIKVLCDFAHEAESLKELFNLARQLTTGRVIGAVRLSPRSAELVQQAGIAIAKGADSVVVYNKYDGDFHSVRQDRREINKTTTQRLAQAISQQGTPCTVIEREDQALRAALDQAKPGDIVVHLVHDNHTQSMQLARSFLRQ